MANIRGHKGYITSALWSHSEPNCIITSSDDQSVKIWNLANIRFKKPPGNKKRRDNKLGEVILEQDENEEDDNEEGEGYQKRKGEDYYSKNKFEKFRDVGNKKSGEKRIDDEDDY